MVVVVTTKILSSSSEDTSGNSNFNSQVVCFGFLQVADLIQVGILAKGQVAEYASGLFGYSDLVG